MADDDGAAGDDWPDLAGRLLRDPETGQTSHVLPIRVYFEDTDFSGLVYHASYLRWCERGRSDFMRLSGNDHRALMAADGQGAEPCAFVVRRMQIDYLKPARIDEVLQVHTRLHELGAAHMRLDQAIWRGEEKLFMARVQVVLVSQSGRPVRLSKALRAVLTGNTGD